MENPMKNWRVELTAGGKSLTEVKIPRGIFQGCSLSPLLFVIVMMPLNHILRKCTGGYELHNLQEKINHLMYMCDIKLFVKNEKESKALIQAVRIYINNIGVESGIKKCAMLIMRYRKRQMTEGIELRNQENIWTLIEKET